MHFAAGAALDALRLAALTGRSRTASPRTRGTSGSAAQPAEKLERAAFATTGCEYNARHLRDGRARGADPHDRHGRRRRALPPPRAAAGRAHGASASGGSSRRRASAISRARGGRRWTRRVRIVGEGPLRDSLARRLGRVSSPARWRRTPCARSSSGPTSWRCPASSRPTATATRCRSSSRRRWRWSCMVVASDEVGLPEIVRAAVRAAACRRATRRRCAPRWRRCWRSGRRSARPPARRRARGCSSAPTCTARRERLAELIERRGILSRMRIAVAADERTGVADAVVDELRRRGHEPLPARRAERRRARRLGVVQRGCGRATSPTAAPSRRSSAAGPGRAPRWRPTRSRGSARRCAATPPTAAGARRWNDANVLALSLRTTSEAQLGEILDAWFAQDASDEPDDRANVARLAEIERA